MVPDKFQEGPSHVSIVSRLGVEKGQTNPVPEKDQDVDRGGSGDPKHSVSKRRLGLRKRKDEKCECKHSARGK